MINNAYDLYLLLIKEGGLAVRKKDSYDSNLFETIKEKFKIDRTSKLKNVSVEEFLIFFFNESEPYNVMMSDVINMFKRANATAEDDKNKIKFEIIFDKIRDKIKIDLSGFIEKHEESKSIVHKSIVKFTSIGEVLELATNLRGFRGYKEKYLVKFCFEIDKREWDRRTTFKKTNKKEIDEFVSIIKSVLDSYYNKYIDYVKNKIIILDNLNLVHTSVIDSYKENKVNDYIFQELTIEEFCKVEKDCFTETIIDALHRITKDISIYYNAPTKIEKIINDLNIIPVEEKVNLLKEYLKLPIWKLRHELYSIWVMSQIVDISDDFKINTQKGKLLFAFKATQQASIKDGQDLSIDLWSELKTKAGISLIGKGRSKSIQPDYTIIQGDHSKADDAIVVIECKQYKTASYSNFSAAMVDYSNVHKNAYVFLVNYGSLTSNFDSKFSNEFSDNSKRSIAIGDFNPKFPNVINEFKDSLRDEILKKLPPTTASTVLSERTSQSLIEKRLNPSKFEFKKGFQIRLTWSEAIQDLDLYLKCDDLTICFCKREGKIKGNTITFRNDMRTIPGSNSHEYETIDIEGDLKEDFEVYVSNYSKEVKEIGKSKAIVQIVFNNTVYHHFECPETNNTDIWNVFKVEKGNLIVVN